MVVSLRKGLTRMTNSLDDLTLDEIIRSIKILRLMNKMRRIFMGRSFVANAKSLVTVCRLLKKGEGMSRETKEYITILTKTPGRYLGIAHIVSRGVTIEERLHSYGMSTSDKGTIDMCREAINDLEVQ